MFYSLPNGVRLQTWRCMALNARTWCRVPTMRMRMTRAWRCSRAAPSIDVRARGRRWAGPQCIGKIQVSPWKRNGYPHPPPLSPAPTERTVTNPPKHTSHPRFFSSLSPPVGASGNFEPCLIFFHGQEHYSNTHTVAFISVLHGVICILTCILQGRYEGTGLWWAGIVFKLQKCCMPRGIGARPSRCGSPLTSRRRATGAFFISRDCST